MNLANLLMNVGTWILCLAGIPQLLSIWNNRHDLRGYSFWASLSLFIGLSCIALSFFLMNMWISLIAQIIPLLMWLTATYYSGRIKQ